MKLLLQIFALVGLLTSLGCVTTKEETRVSSSLSAREYNEIYSTYSKRPTWVTLRKMSDGNSVLTIEMEQYAYNPTASHAPEHMTPYRVSFDERFADQYISLIDKYLEWESKAQKRGDAFTKIIGKANTWAAMGTLKLGFYFHSGNESSHLLMVGLDLGISGVVDEQYYERKDAIKLKDLILQMKLGEIKHTEIDAVYN